jgi:hypothetical protein
LAAAIWPKVYGSSTIGVKKSTVLTIARSELRRSTSGRDLLRQPEQLGLLAADDFSHE